MSRCELTFICLAWALLNILDLLSFILSRKFSAIICLCPHSISSRTSIKLDFLLSFHVYIFVCKGFIMYRVGRVGTQFWATAFLLAARALLSSSCFLLA